MSYNGDQIHHMKRISRGSMAHWLKMLQAQLLEAFLYSIFCVFLYIFSAHTTLVYRPLSLARQNHKKIRENEFALSLSSSYFKAQSAFQWDLSVREPTHTTTPATTEGLVLPFILLTAFCALKSRLKDIFYAHPNSSLT